MPRSYWLDLFTYTTWQEFLKAGGTVSGFRAQRWTTVQQIKAGDYLLCYLTGLSRWVGLLEVASPAFRDNSPIWKDEDFPSRVKVKTLIALTPEISVPILEMRDKLTIFNDQKNRMAWTGRVRGSPAKWKPTDGEIIVKALRDAEKNPIVRDFDKKKLARRPKALKAKIGAVTVPESDDLPSETHPPQRENTAHDEIQWLLLKLGSEMGLDIWVARNDRGKRVNGKNFTDLPRLMKDLPAQFDEATNRTIQLIDVLWLKRNAIVAAFEIESTTSIYSGLLRMSDLIAMQPNLNIPLYLVAPDDRRNKVILEVNRPTFSRLSPPMKEMCRFISFSGLKEKVDRAGSLARYLKPEFLEELSESCEAEE